MILTPCVLIFEIYVLNLILVFSINCLCLDSISLADLRPLHKLKIDGPEPEIDVPSPFDFAAIFLISLKYGINFLL